MHVYGCTCRACGRKVNIVFEFAVFVVLQVCVHAFSAYHTARIILAGIFGRLLEKIKYCDLWFLVVTGSRSRS